MNQPESHSPEKEPLSSMHMLQEYIRHKDTYEAAKLQPGSTEYIFPAEEAVPLVINEKLGVKQELLAMIFAGGDSFAVIKSFHSHDNKEEQKYLLSHMSMPGGRALLIGEISSDHPLLIGRDPQPELAKDVSREHFTVRWTGEAQGNAIEVRDLNSTNGTEIVKPRQVPKEEVTPKHIMKSVFNRFRASKRKQKAENSNIPTADPLSDVNTWAPHPADVKSLYR